MIINSNSWCVPLLVNFHLLLLDSFELFLQEQISILCVDSAAQIFDIHKNFIWF
jgi:hypothetical protein